MPGGYRENSINHDVTGEHVYTEIQCGLELDKFDKERENVYAQSVGKRVGAKTPRRTPRLYGPSLCLISRACPLYYLPS